MQKPKVPNLHTGPWRLSEIGKSIAKPKHGLTVFSCFHCGGGSSMGYKLAGFDVLGGVEIDPQMMDLYRRNHNPRLSYLEGVQDFKKRPDKELPKELFNLDVLDGSPPCSSFSMAGSREDAWNEKKKFREGQADQVLDDLFFHFIDVAAKLKPRMVVAENVKGLLAGNARGYVKDIFSSFKAAGYETQLFLLNSSKMGVPQMRERTFFIARRADLQMPKLVLEFQEPIISVTQAFQGLKPADAKALSKEAIKWWRRTSIGRLFSVCGASTGKMNRRLHPELPAWTQTATPNLFHWSEPRHLTGPECARIQSFPDDYDFMDAKPGYVCGMSVPPLMMQRVAREVAGALLAGAR